MLCESFLFIPRFDLGVSRTAFNEMTGRHFDIQLDRGKTGFQNGY